MAECPEGHPNPAGWEFCNECGAPIDATADEQERRDWSRTRWAMAAIGVLVAIAVIGGGILLAVTLDEKRSAGSNPPSADQSAIGEWAAGAGAHVTEMENVLEDTQNALDSFDRRGLQTACENLHEVAGVDLPAHLPSPDPDLTSELTAATEDAHEAAHMCLATMAGSTNNTSTEFVTHVDEAVRNVAAAQLRIKRALRGDH